MKLACIFGHVYVPFPAQYALGGGKRADVPLLVRRCDRCEKYHPRDLRDAIRWATVRRKEQS